jgi:hypothetical protein
VASTTVDCTKQVDRQRGERVADQPQAAALALLAGAGQLPDHHGGRADLDQRIEREPGQRHRPRRDRRDGQHDDPSHIPRQDRVLQRKAPPQQCRAYLVIGHCHSRSLPAADAICGQVNLFLFTRRG